MFDLRKFIDDLNNMVEDGATTENLKIYVIATLQLAIIKGEIIIPIKEEKEEDNNEET